MLKSLSQMTHFDNLIYKNGLHQQNYAFEKPLISVSLDLVAKLWLTKLATKSRLECTYAMYDFQKSKIDFTIKHSTSQLAYILHSCNNFRFTNFSLTSDAAKSSLMLFQEKRQHTRLLVREVFVNFLFFNVTRNLTH